MYNVTGPIGCVCFRPQLYEIQFAPHNPRKCLSLHLTEIICLLVVSSIYVVWISRLCLSAHCCYATAD